MVLVLKADNLAAELEKSWREKFKHERGIKALTSFPFTRGELANFIKKRLFDSNDAILVTQIPPFLLYVLNGYPSS